MLIEFLTQNLLWTQGSVLLYSYVAFAVLGMFFWRPLVPLVLALFFFSVFFFRNPVRVCPEALRNTNVIVCPADGRVVAVNSELNEEERAAGYAKKVAIFLSVFDVHVTRIPVSGSIERIMYRPGAFFAAFEPKSSVYNERTDVIVHDAAHDRNIMIRQIAGIIARRICWWVSQKEQVNAGDAYGMIRFGSRVELFVPEQVTCAVQVGQKVYGGQTVIGYWQ